MHPYKSDHQRVPIIVGINDHGDYHIFLEDNCRCCIIFWYTIYLIPTIRAKDIFDGCITFVLYDIGGKRWIALGYVLYVQGCQSIGSGSRVLHEAWPIIGL